MEILCRVTVKLYFYLHFYVELKLSPELRAECFQARLWLWWDRGGSGERRHYNRMCGGKKILARQTRPGYNRE